LIIFPYSLFCQPVWKTPTLRNALANYWGRQDLIIGLRNIQGCWKKQESLEKFNYNTKLYDQCQMKGRYVKLEEISKKEHVNVDSMFGKDFMKKHRFDISPRNG